MRRGHYKPVRKTKMVGFNVTPDEYKVIMSAADSARMVRSEWLRQAVLSKAKEEGAQS